MAGSTGEIAPPEIRAEIRASRKPGASRKPVLPRSAPIRPYSVAAEAGGLSGPVLPISAVYQVRLIGGLIAADLLIILVALVVGGLASTSHVGTTLLAFAGTAAGLQAAGHAFGLYDARSTTRLQRSVWPIVWIGLFATGIAALWALASGEQTAVTRVALVGAAATLVLMLLRLILAAWLERHAAALSERLVLIGTCGAVSRLLAAPGTTGIPQRLVGVIAIGDPGEAPLGLLASFDPARSDPAAVLADFWRIGDALREHTSELDRLVIVSADLDEATIAATLERLEHLPFEIALVPQGAALTEAADPLDRGNCVVLRRAAITRWGFVCKRALDIAAATILLVCMAPLLLCIAVLIRCGSRGPALFRQTRWGWNNEPFTVFKFRTMWFDAASADGSVQATRGDSRVTPIGALLRSTSLDELPQLLNVLNGTMSLVGPRPHPVELNLRYLGIIDRYAGRHRVTPGITGLAQIKGFRGETRSPAAMQKRVEADLEYIRTRSLGTDMWILLRTVVSVIRGMNAY